MATELDDSQRRDAFRRKIETKVAAGLRGGVEADVSLIAMVGPPEAEVLLSFSRGNRNESEATVEAYARDMVAGNWTVENGNPIVLTASGRLANGHHRLRAVVAAKTVIRLKISFGNPEEALDVADGHRPRSLADRFALRGERNTHRTLAALRMCMVLCDNKRSLTAKRTMTEIEAAFVDHAPALAALRGHFHHKFPASFWGALLFAHPINPAAVDALAAEVVRGEGITGPAYTIRDHLLKSRSAGAAYMIRTAQCTLFAVRAYLERRPLTRFSFQPDTEIVEWFIARRPK